jgi:hypothetical protein
VTKINVAVIEANTRDGGHAAIRILGLSVMPSDPTFRIDPIDEALAQDGEVDWPTGPRRPAAVVKHDTGYDLILGPDVLDSPLLLPGTPVVISITDTPAMAELIWPSITNRRSRTSRPVIVTDALREAERQSIEIRRRDAAANLAAATARVEAEMRAAVPERRAANSRGNRAKVAPGPTLVTGAAETIWSGPESAAQTTQTGATKGAGHDPKTVSGRVLSGFSLPLNGSQSASTLIRQEGQSVLPLPHASGTALAPLPQPVEPPPSRFGRQVAAFFGGMAAAALLVFGLLQFRVLQLQPSGQMLAGTPDIALTAARHAGSLRTVLATGGVSPRGRAASGVDGNAALRLADAYLYGAADAQRDQGEASFWLRHALSQAIDHESMKWALTQLGSIYAAPEGFEPDFAKARLLWEISGALGDPVALCFNASLYEHGLGVPKHRDLARALFERARNAGGCRGVEDVIGRTK